VLLSDRDKICPMIISLSTVGCLVYLDREEKLTLTVCSICVIRAFTAEDCEKVPR
jgi:hypothetical protein